MLVGGLCAVVWGVVTLPDYHYGAQALLAIIGGALALLFGSSLAICEYRYFHPQNEYALIVGLDTFKAVPPDGTESCIWSDLGPFEVKEMVTTHKGRERKTYECIGHLGGVDIEIALGDFAVLCGVDDQARAVGMTRALNQVRNLMQMRQSGDAAPLFKPPIGLVVGPLLPPKKAQPLKVKSVIQRQ